MHSTRVRMRGDFRSAAIQQLVPVAHAGGIDRGGRLALADPQVLRHVVVRRADTRGDLADIERRFNQQADDADSCLVPERFQCDDAIVDPAGGFGVAWGDSRKS